MQIISGIIDIILIIIFIKMYLKLKNIDYNLNYFFRKDNKIEVSLKKWKCPQCENMNSNDFYICTRCGYKLK